MRVRRSCGEMISRMALSLTDGHHEVGGHGVGELAGVLDPDGSKHRIVVETVRELDVLLEEGDHLLGGCVERWA